MVGNLMDAFETSADQEVAECLQNYSDDRMIDEIAYGNGHVGWPHNTERFRELIGIGPMMKGKGDKAKKKGKGDGKWKDDWQSGKGWDKDWGKDWSKGGKKGWGMDGWGMDGWGTGKW